MRFALEAERNRTAFPHGNKARAARALGINRRSLYRLLEEYGLE